MIIFAVMNVAVRFRSKLICYLFFSALSFNGWAQPMIYQGHYPFAQKGITKAQKIKLNISILKEAKVKEIVYQEQQQVIVDSFADFRVALGSGILMNGNFSGINWSDGAYFLQLQSDSFENRKQLYTYETQLRAITELLPKNKEGIATADTATDCGEIVIPNPHHKRPRKVTVDLTTSYVNLRYPADTYPVYRHFEWFDDNLDGIGNALVLSYSENTTHAFFENTKLMGEVKLYSSPFQQLKISSEANLVRLTLTKPEPITNFSTTYAIKGPWKMIYYIEW